MTMAIKDKDTLTHLITAMAIARSVAFLDSDSSTVKDPDQFLIDLVKHCADQPIFFVMREKKIKQATKALGEAAWREFTGAVRSKDFKGCREAIGRGVQDIVRVSVGDEGYEVILERVNPVGKMLKDYADLETEEMQLLMLATGRGIRKELARRLIYTGPID